MKSLALAALIVFAPFAQASYYTINCSDAAGTVVWEEGYNSNTIRLTYYGIVTGELEFPLDQVSIQTTDLAVINEKTIQNNCGDSYTTKTYVAQVSVTPAARNPDVFQSYFPHKKVRATVICEHKSTRTGNCHLAE